MLEITNPTLQLKRAREWGRKLTNVTKRNMHKKCSQSQMNFNWLWQLRQNLPWSLATSLCHGNTAYHHLFSLHSLSLSEIFQILDGSNSIQMGFFSLDKISLCKILTLLCFNLHPWVSCYHFLNVVYPTNELMPFFSVIFFSKDSRVFKWLLSGMALWSPFRLMEKSIRSIMAQWSLLLSLAALTPATHLSCLEQVGATHIEFFALSWDFETDWVLVGHIF